MPFDVTIVGELNLDLILYGLPQELPVERELLATGFSMTLGSSSAIVAHNLACLRNRVGFITRVGPDEMGQIALTRLASSGVDLSRVTRSTTGTGVTLLLPHGNARRVLTYPGTMAEMGRKDVDTKYLGTGRHFHLSSLFLHRALQPDLPEIFRYLKKRGLTISLDTNDDPEDMWGGVLEELLPYVDVLLPNEYEAKCIARRDDLEDALARLAERVPLVGVKRSSNGSTVLHEGKRIDVPGLRVEAVDTIGAGDSYNAGFLAAFLRGVEPRVCAECGNITGALSTQRSGGTEAFRDAELREAFLAEHGFYQRLDAAVMNA
jgi:sugar/nucleoside kinase (ribokinase family)